MTAVNYTAQAFATNKTQQAVNQAEHGFAVGLLVINDALAGPPNWITSQANSIDDCFGTMMVSSVIDVNNFVVTEVGYVTNITTQTFVAGENYYLSPTVAGALQTAIPSSSGQVILGCFKADTTHSGYFFGGSGQLIGSGSLSGWSVITANQTLAVNNGYFVNGSGALNDLLLPTSCVVGDTIKIWDIGGNGFTLTQSANQSVLVGSQFSTVGTGGSIASSQLGNLIEIICTANNLTFTAAPGMSSFNVT